VSVEELVKEQIMISESELKEKLNELNEILKELIYNTKSVVRHVEELVSIIDIEGFKADIDVKMHIAILEESIINTSQVVAEFIKQLIHSKIKIYVKK